MCVTGHSQSHVTLCLVYLSLAVPIEEPVHERERERETETDVERERERQGQMERESDCWSGDGTCALHTLFSSPE